MDIHHLRCFVAVARHGKIQDAADALFVTRQAASKTLAQMEIDLGAPLFVRSHNGITLNERGQRFVERAEALLRDFDALQGDMREDDSLTSIKIGIPFTTNHHFWSILNDYLAKNADWLELEAVNCLDAQCHRMLESGDIDMGISLRPFRSSVGDGRWIATSPILIALNESHPLASKECLIRSDLVGQPLIYYMNGYENLPWLDAEGPRPAYTVNDILLAFDLVLQGKGLFPVPALSILSSSMQGVLFLPYHGPDDRDDFYCSISSPAGQDKRKLRACMAVRGALESAGRASLSRRV